MFPSPTSKKCLVDSKKIVFYIAGCGTFINKLDFPNIEFFPVSIGEKREKGRGVYVQVHYSKATRNKKGNH